jgi:hypothetical protein
MAPVAAMTTAMSAASVASATSPAASTAISASIPASIPAMRTASALIARIAIEVWLILRFLGEVSPAFDDDRSSGCGLTLRCGSSDTSFGAAASLRLHLRALFLQNSFA